MEHSNKPLTLEQLREMDGCAVRVFPRNEYSELGGVCVVSVGESDEYSGAYIPGVDHWYWSFDSYNEQWLAYSYQTAHIELESWKSEWERVCGSSECKNCGYDTKVESHFCPHCGKAMDEHALNIIKNQIGG